MTSVDLRHIVDMKLAEGFLLWQESRIDLPPVSERYLAANALAKVYNGPDAISLAAACQCFYYFRMLHRMVDQYPTWSTLLGDYFFSQFSKNLIPLNSTLLTDAFSTFLKNDINNQGDVSEYMAFIQDLPKVLR